MSVFDFLRNLDVFTNKDIKNPEKCIIKGLISFLAFFAVIIIGSISMIMQYKNPSIKNIYSFNDYVNNWNFGWPQKEVLYKFELILSNFKFINKNTSTNKFLNDCDTFVYSSDHEPYVSVNKTSHFEPFLEETYIKYDFLIDMSENKAIVISYKCNNTINNFSFVSVEFSLSRVNKHNNRIFDKMLNLDPDGSLRVGQSNKTHLIKVKLEVKNTYIIEENKNTLIQSDTWKNDYNLKPNLYGKKFIQNTISSEKKPKVISNMIAKIFYNTINMCEINVIEYNSFYSSLPTIFYFYRVLCFIINSWCFLIEFR